MNKFEKQRSNLLGSAEQRFVDDVVWEQPPELRFDDVIFPSCLLFHLLVKQV